MNIIASMRWMTKEEPYQSHVDIPPQQGLSFTRSKWIVADIQRGTLLGDKGRDFGRGCFNAFFNIAIIGRSLGKGGGHGCDFWSKGRLVSFRKDCKSLIETNL